ncbi:MAG: SNF2 helicase associated domain-containing protein [Clostridium sp.]|jgi:superfamily II DNA or RNA helicase
MEIVELNWDTFWKGEVRIKGRVLDESREYGTSVFIKGSQIFDYSCSCAEGNSFRGPCAHARAVLKAFQEREEEERMRRIPVSTSPEVRSMVREYTEREFTDILAAEEEGTAELFPRLSFRQQSVFLELRLGKTKLYQVRNLLEFARAVREGRQVEYGKGMEFIHTELAFGQESRPLLQLILEEAGRYESHFGEIKGGTGPLPSLRSFRLEGVFMDRFFSLMAGKEISVLEESGVERVLPVIYKNPEFLVEVTPEGAGGIAVSIPESIRAFSGETGFYVMEPQGWCICDGEYRKNTALFLKEMMSARSRSGGRRGVTVSRRDVSLFASRVLVRLKEGGILRMEGTDWEALQPEPLSARFEFDSDNPGEIRLHPVFSYGSFSFSPLEDDTVPREICRDVPGEFRISRLIHRYFSYREDERGSFLIHGDEERIFRLLKQGLREFGELGEVWLSESVRAMRILPPPVIIMGVSVSGGWLDLSFQAGDFDGAELYRILSQYRKKKKCYRTKNGAFLELSGEGLQTVADMAEELELKKAQLEEGSVRLPAFRAFYLEELAREDTGLNFHGNENFYSIIQELDTPDPAVFQVPGEMEGILREYQKAGFSWLRALDRHGFGGILADDMGLGKTIQILALLSSVHGEAGPEAGLLSLIVCPASLVYNWSHECAHFAPSLRVLPVTGAAAERQQLLSSASQYDVLITSYDLLKRDLALYQNFYFRFEVLDEAQVIKNAATRGARAVKAIRAKTRFALTGTPVENRLSELWSIFDYLMPGFLAGSRKFRNIYEIPIVRDGNKAVLERLHRRIRPFVLRRLKADILTELPEKLERICYSAAQGSQRELYRAEAQLLKEQLEKSEQSLSGGRKLEILSRMTRLRQICCDPSLCYDGYTGGSAKLETCLSLLSSAVEAGHKILLFSQFASMLEILSGRLSRAGISHYLLTGATSKEERDRLVTAFGREEVPVFLISLKAGGTGLNLTAADMVIHYDPWWNAAAQNQATDRVHRIGQERVVTVYRLIMKDTIEENILKLQESKKKLAEQIVTEGTVSLGDLGRDELLELCSG